MPRHVPLFVGGDWVRTGVAEPNADPASGEDLDLICQADARLIERAMDAAQTAFRKLAQLPAHHHADLCRRVGELLRERESDVAAMITAESGKPLPFATGEAQRAAAIFTHAAEQAAIAVEQLPVAADRVRAGAGRIAIARRFPVGIVLGIGSYVQPLVGIAHKVAAAFAVGCPIVIKPSPLTPQSALLLARLIEEAGALPGQLSVLACDHGLTEQLVRDGRFALVHFTGSREVGGRVREWAGSTRTALQTGGNAATLIHGDVEGPLERVVDRVLVGAIGAAGQSCLRIQRLYVHRQIANDVTRLLIERFEATIPGEPMNHDTLVGPMITERHAEDALARVRAAEVDGAVVVAGGKRYGAYVIPTLLTDVHHEDPIQQEDLLAPVLILNVYNEFEHGLRQADATPYALQAGLFTGSIERMMQARETLRVGTLNINDYSALRLDPLPYGGGHGSGDAREGLRESIESMTEIRTMVIRARP